MEITRPKMIVAVVAGVVCLIVLLQNTQVVTLRFLFWEASMSRIILLPFVLMTGGIIGFFIGRYSRE